MSLRRYAFAALIVVVVAACSGGGGHASDLLSGLVVRTLPRGPAVGVKAALACPAPSGYSVFVTNNVAGARYDDTTNSWRATPGDPYGSLGSGGCLTDGVIQLAGPARYQPKRSSIFDQERRTWRQFPPSPLDGSPNASAIQSGNSIFVIGTLGHRVVAASYDLATQTWRTLPSPPPTKATQPAAFGDQPLLWTGRYVVLLFGPSNSPGYEPLRYDPATEHWAKLAINPVQMLASIVTTIGPDIAVIGEQNNPSGRPQDDETSTAAVRLDVARGRWIAMAPPPRSKYGENDDRSRIVTPRAVWTGTSLILWTGLMHSGPADETPVLAYSPRHDRWTTLGIVHKDLCCGAAPSAASVWTGREMIVTFRSEAIAVAPRHT